MPEGNSNGNVTNNSFTKTICSICYEDLKPIIEDLQSISVCGHVFHELCLQQWFEYCPNGKKRSCPVCKQTCSNANVGRLYFQSVGDPNDATLTQKPHDYEEIPEELRKEVSRLEGKANALASALEHQQKELKEVKDQLLISKEQLKVEVMLKNEAITQKSTTQQLLRMKSEELDKSTLERMKAQERSLALAKELAAIKLASDLNLTEEEIIKLASLGHDTGSKETVDVLRKSLIIRNKSYKELMAKCNTLGRGEARSLSKLEKANEKIKKLKLRVQELETAVEMKDNEALRVLKEKDSKLYTSFLANKMKEPADQTNFSKAAEMPDKSFCSKKVEPLKPMSRKNTTEDNIPGNNYGQNEQERCSSTINEVEGLLHSSTQVHEFSYQNSIPCTHNSAVTKSSHVARQDATFDTQNEVEMSRPCDRSGMSCYQGVGMGTKVESKGPPADVDDEVICYGGTNPFQTSFHIRKETGSSVPVAQPGVNCFSGGLMGPDGTNRHLGKWCKKVQNSGSSSSSGLQRSNARAGDLITVGADGRGGRIKVMRPLDRSTLDNKDTSFWPKKCKLSTKTNRSQPQGHLQIDHFFQKKGQ
ncbi:hypothetical protein ACJIZ3_018493 [Penstemon smallii]|uniref:RING-type domain-containing protein n=1 Tax=Penstemon smallii TaxID=265156 RepID=A0ABD3SZE6_9LAMI